ncbi:MAG: TonB family protein [Candidatus Eiseniibacteriota bacterium]|jgi:protein TonB
MRAGTEYWKLNSRYVRYCAYGLLISVVGHILYLTFGPAPEAKPYELREKKIEVIDIPDEIFIPPPPQEVERPQLPQEAEVSDEVDEEETIEETEFNPFQPPVAPARQARQEAFVAFDTPPRAVRKVEPDYPELARQAHAQGTVHVQVTIDETGRVINAAVIKSDTIQSLEEAAIAAAYKFLFTPAKQRDVPVKARIVLPFRFRLRG